MLDDLPDRYAKIPSCEGDPRLLARALLNVLDQYPPPASAHTVIYVLYHTADTHRLWLSTTTAAGELCKHLLEAYQNELALLKSCSLDDSVMFAWSFEIAPTAEPHILELKYIRRRQQPLATLEIIFRDFDKGGQPEVLNLVMRSQPPLKDNASLLAVAEAKSPSIRVAPHVDSFQRGLRWSRRLVYLTREWNWFRVGPHPACEFVCEPLEQTWTVVFQEKDRQLLIAENAEGMKVLRKSESSSELILREASTEVRMEVRILVPAPTFEAQMQQNRVPICDLHITSRVLPLGPALGYGYVADELKRYSGQAIRSCIRLSVDGAYLFLVEHEQVYCMDHQGSSPRLLQPGDSIVFDGMVATWQPFALENSDPLSAYFCGQLTFDKPIRRRLATNIKRSLRDIFFEHLDELQGQVFLISENGFDFRLQPPGGASARPVWVKSDRLSQFELYASGEARWSLENFSTDCVEFIVGSTRFCLAAT